jgi:acetyl-CoA carboxylase carboxyltransferase component
MTPQDLNQELLRRREAIRRSGGPEAEQKQHARGKLTARERIDRLLDPGSFDELDSHLELRHTRFWMDEQPSPGDGAVVGLGRIDGRRVALAAQDFTVMGGSFSEAQAHKVCRVLDLALASGIPFLSLNDSVGARIQEGVWSLAGYSKLFWRNTRASGVIPQISIGLGPCAGGSVYSPALTDFIIMTADISHMFITGPRVIEALTGERVDLDTLGGAHTHAALSGVAHFVAADEEQAFAMTRKLLSYLPSNNAELPPRSRPQDAPTGAGPLLDTLVPPDGSESYDIHELIARIFDPQSFFEIQASFAPNAVVGFARLDGGVAGVVANQPDRSGGVLDIDASDKIARFVRFCDAFNVPLVTFVDCPGFMPGTEQEHGGIIRHGAKIVYAYAAASVPKICIVTRKAYGGAYIAMSSKDLGTDLVYGWPTARVAVMGAEGAVGVLFRKELAQAKEPEAERSRLIGQFREQFDNPYAAASSGHLDDVILPSETRARLIADLDMLRDKRATPLPRKHGNIPL